MKKLPILFAAAALCTLASLAWGSTFALLVQNRVRFPEVSATAPCALTFDGRPTVDVHHPLVDASGIRHGVGVEVLICRQHISGKIVTLAEASSEARAFMQDRWGAYGCKEHYAPEWQEAYYEWKFFFLCKKAVIPPFEITIPDKAK